MLLAKKIKLSKWWGLARQFAEEYLIGKLVRILGNDEVLKLTNLQNFE